ncbi:hypothetical protein A6C57_26000 [Fibrella sp. ES10-3-2-2]
MKNPFPALIAYMIVQTVMLYPTASGFALLAVVFVGWALALNELFSISDGNSPEPVYLPEV